MAFADGVMPAAASAIRLSDVFTLSSSSYSSKDVHLQLRQDRSIRIKKALCIVSNHAGA